MSDAPYFTHRFLGIDIKFPYADPYGAQRAIMGKSMTAFLNSENALLESPTGTGKSLALLSSALAYQEHVYQHPKSENQERIPVIYASRTHTQLSQLVGELKRLPYAPKMTVLASREKCCVYPPVRDSGNVDYNCQMQRHECPYAANGNQVPPEIAYSKFDIESLKKYCEDNIKCPFLITRALLSSADLIICAYNYIIDPVIRNTFKDMLNGAIIILDEAHNIEDECRSSGTLRITYKQFEIMKTDIEQAIETANKNTNLDQKTKEWLHEIKQSLIPIGEVITAILDWFVSRRERWQEGDKNFVENDEVTRLSSWKLTSKTWPNLVRCFDNVCGSVKGNNQMPQALVKHLTEFYKKFELIFSNSSKNVLDYKLICQFGKDLEHDALQLLCMNPAIVFRSVPENAHSIILSSGTLSPLESFSSELGTKFQIQLTTNHVINPEQVLACCLSNGISKTIFNSSKNALERDEDNIFLSLGETFRYLLPSIPDGALLFLPSKTILSRLMKNWAKNHIIESIDRIKPIFAESMNSKNDTDLYKKFKESIDIGKGGFMIAVCRGKLSEGIDFHDSQSRAVFLFGIPYPDMGSDSIKEKIKYNKMRSNRYGNKVQLLTGEEWYSAQAYRALFQAIGRCVRHLRDYGAVILLDERLKSDMSRFPNWVKRSYYENMDIHSLRNKLVEFYSKMKEMFPADNSKKFLLDSSLNLCCSSCGICAVELKKLDLNGVQTIEKKGFLEMVGQTTPKAVMNITIYQRTAVHVIQDEVIWKNEDQVGYKPIKCECGEILGGNNFAVSSINGHLMDTFWILIDKVDVVQGNSRMLLETLINGEKDQENHEYLDDIDDEEAEELLASLES